MLEKGCLSIDDACVIERVSVMMPKYKVHEPTTPPYLNWAECASCKREVVGSIPTGGSSKKIKNERGNVHWES